MSSIRLLLPVLVLSGACGRGAPSHANRSDAGPAETRDVADPDATGAGTPGPDAPTGLDAARPLTPLPPQPLFTSLTAPPFPEAVVSVPNGATTVRPVIIVLHGAGDRPDWNCDAWRHITGAQGFVLCPRGDYDPAGSTASDRRFTLRGGAHLRDYVQASLDALAARFSGYVDLERPIVTGFSLGATEIAQLALSDPGRFPRVAELEGGFDVWTPPRIAAFAARGGSRVLFGCGSTWCLAPARAAARRLRDGGVESRVVFAAVGHTNDRPLQEAIMAELAWFLDGDARWVASP